MTLCKSCQTELTPFNEVICMKRGKPYRRGCCKQCDADRMARNDYARLSDGELRARITRYTRLIKFAEEELEARNGK